MTSLEQLVGSPLLSPHLSYLARPNSSAPVRSVALVEDLQQLEGAAGQAIVLVTRAGSAVARSYRVDVALRIAGSLRVAALVLSGPAVAEVTSTTVALADRLGVALLGASPGSDLAQLAIAIGRELSGDVALLRAHTALRAIQAHPVDGRPEAIAERAGAALGVPIRLVHRRPPTGVAVPVRDRDRGQTEAWLSATKGEGDLALALDLTLSLAAAGTEQALDRLRRAENLPLESRGAVLSELLIAPRAARDPIAHRARSLGIVIDGWHVAARLDFENLVGTSEPDAAAADRERMSLATAAVHTLRADGDWHSARAGAGVVLIRTFPGDPGAAAAVRAGHLIERTLDSLRDSIPTTLVHCGVGSAHQGADGLLASASEANAAVAVARTSQHPWTAVTFDAAGLRRGLVEWYASETAKDAIAGVLAPLVELGGARAERLIRTLHVYLDQQGSLTKAAEVLNLHRNAVSYRVNQIFDLLDVDADNPDDRLLLQLACRAHELAP